MVKEIIAIIEKASESINFFFQISNSLVWKYLLGFKPESEYGSNVRRLLSRLVLIVAIGIVVQAVFQPVFFEENRFIHRIYSYYFFVVSLIFFCSNVVIVTFKNDEAFVVNTTRLFFDILISAMFHIVSFSYFYRRWGILDPEIEMVSSINFFDHLYFSSVTFSTLGYGDFRPSGDSRLIAAYEALIGNMHIGFLVGAAFLAASNSGKANK